MNETLTSVVQRIHYIGLSNLAVLLSVVLFGCVVFLRAVVFSFRRSKQKYGLKWTLIAFAVSLLWTLGLQCYFNQVNPDFAKQIYDTLGTTALQGIFAFLCAVAYLFQTNRIGLRMTVKMRQALFGVCACAALTAQVLSMGPLL